MAMNIQIAVPDGPAAAGADKIASSLRKVEEAGKKAGAATEKGLKDASLAAMQAKAQLQTLATSAARGFGAVAEAMKREGDMYKSIRGDMQQYKQDLQAIDALHRKGAISAAEHAAAEQRSRSSNGIGGPQAPNSYGDQVASNAGQSIAAMVGPAALAGAAIGALTSGIGEMIRRSEEIDEATNHLVKFYGSFDAASQQVGRFKDLSDELRVSLAEGVAAYDAVEGASQKLYLTTQQQIAIAKNLGATMKVDGASVADVVPVMERLEFAIEKNSISGLEMQKMMKKYPELGAAWRKEFEMTTPELIKAANSGELVEKGLGRLVTTYENNTDALGKLKDMHVTSAEVEATHGAAILDMYRKMLPWNVAVRDGVAAGLAWEEQVARNGLAVKKMANAVNESAAAWANLQAAVASATAFATIGAAVDKATQAIKDYDKVSVLIGRDKHTDFASNMALLGRQQAEGLISTKTYEEAVKKLGDAFKGTAKAARELMDADAGVSSRRNIAVRSVYGSFGAPNTDNFVPTTSQTGGLDRPQTDYTGVGRTGNSGILGDPAGYKDIAASMKETLTVSEKLSETGLAIESAFTNVATSLGDSLVDAANGADVAWQDTLSNLLVGFEKAIMQALILQAIGSSTGGVGGGGSGILGALFGGATGFDGVMGGGGLRRMPAFATGGDAMVGGAGATDSRIAMLRVTPGESIHVRTPDQQRAAASARGGGATVTNVIQNDRRALIPALRSKEGHAEMLNFINVYQGPIKSILGR